jgi:hypothetical protein
LSISQATTFENNSGAYSNYFKRELADHAVLSRYATPIVKSALPSAFYGFFLLPTDKEDGFWRHRIIDGLSWGAGGAAAGAMGELMFERFSKWRTPQPGDGSFESELKEQSSNLLSLAARGSVNGITKTTVFTLLGQQSLPPPREFPRPGEPISLLPLPWEQSNP